MALIELGDVSGARTPEPVADRITAGLDRRRLRPVALLAVLICLLACGAATRPGAPGVRLLWTAPHDQEEDSVALAGDTLYVLSGGERSELVAYSLTDGRRLWRWSTDAHLISVGPAPDGGPVLVTADPASSGDPDGPAALASRTTIALRAASGAELWRRPGEPHAEGIEAGSALLKRFDPRGGIGSLSRVRLEDGVPLWTRDDGAPIQDVGVEAAGGRVVTRTAAGDVTVLAWADGARLASRRITAGAGRYSELSVGAGLLYMSAFGPGDPDTDVYRLDGLEPLISGPLANCVGVICTWGQGGFAALDPGNGRELWRGPEIIASVMTEDRILTDRQNGSEHVLLDSRTGRALSPPVPGWMAYPDRWQDEILLLRPTSEPIGRTSVTRVDLATGRVSVLGSLEPLPDQQGCRTAPGYLVCTGWDRMVVAAVPR
ncbi:PQQ-binding-like beta-propeller repeat protein [Actinoplanes sp. NPDC023714]|uniref:outer membrane protein assembly factor BamB family protein n=1 Tax=Actinoplanes sp. NPDC023714 TaxID=3154322 RepID=UPI0033D2649B